MKKLFCLTLLTLNFTSFLYSQKLIEEFHLPTPQKRVESNYSNLTVIDSRVDTTNMGVVQKGAFNRKALLVAKIDLKAQIKHVFKHAISLTAGPGELVLNVRDFKFAEITDAFSETGYCYLRADLFAKRDSTYSKIGFFDRVLEVSALDVTQKNIKNGSENLITFLTSNLSKSNYGDSYTMDEIKNIASIEKRKIPIYNTTKYNDGVYMKFDNFKDNAPNIKDISVKINKKGIITRVEWNRSTTQKLEINIQDIYAVVHEGKAYVSANNKMVPLEFKNDDFYFTGRAKVTASGGSVVLASAFFGIIGGLIASNDSSEFIMKIDHLNGATVQVKEIGN
jgi:hypothetical protein